MLSFGSTGRLELHTTYSGPRLRGRKWYGGNELDSSVLKCLQRQQIPYAVWQSTVYSPDGISPETLLSSFSKSSTMKIAPPPIHLGDRLVAPFSAPYSHKPMSILVYCNDAAGNATD
jgi:hypothetical protein